MKAAPVRLGHSLGDKQLATDDAALHHALDLATGKALLEPRTPSDPTTVERAERVLDARPRPIYSYVGDLHPDLGSVGLIVSQRWAERAIQGVSKCDSGGLAGGKGCFRSCPGARARCRAAVAVEPTACAATEWIAHFEREITTSYAHGVGDYVSGDAPDASTWEDARKHCIDAARRRGDGVDRRLWTWELRIRAPPQPEEIEVVVVSQLGYRKIQHIFTHEDIVLPAHIRIILGDDDAGDPGSWFSVPAVRTALAGE
jgi:hypothetical protein